MIQIDMYMPESCRECWFLLYDTNTGETSCGIKNMPLARYFQALSFEGRHKECPLVDVPEINVGDMVNERPKIIRCKDCKWAEVSATGHLSICSHLKGLIDPSPTSYCSYAERKTDG